MAKRQVKDGGPVIDPATLTPSEAAILADLAVRMRIVRDSILGGRARLPLADLITGWSLEVDRMVIEADNSPAPPALTALVPNTAQLGTPSFTLHVMGAGFDATTVILWNGAPEPTTLVSPTEVTTGVNMETASVAVTLPVSVQGAGGMSVELPFTFTPAAV